MAKKFPTTNIYCKFHPKIVKLACPKCYAINVWRMRRHTCEGDRQELRWHEEILDSHCTEQLFVRKPQDICQKCPPPLPHIDPCNMSGMSCLVSWTLSNRLYGVCCKFKNNYFRNFPKCLEGFQQLAILWLLCDVSWCFYFPVKWLRLDDFEIDRSLSPPSVLLWEAAVVGSLCEWPNYTTCFYLFIKTWVVLQMFLLLTLRSTY